MTVDRWIALGACIAAFISAIAAFFVVAQSSLQRKLAYKPHINFKPLHFKYEANLNKHDILNPVTFTNIDSAPKNKSKCAVNIGLGTAIDVSIEWIHDSNKIVELLNEIFSKVDDGTKITTEKSIIVMDVPNDDENRYRHGRDLKSDNIDYILPYNQHPHPTDIIFPLTYLSLNCALIIYSLNILKVMNCSMSTTSLIVQHRDIGGVLYKHEYDVKIKFEKSYTKNGVVKLYGQVMFSQKQGSKTAIGLARIRKSYADFMSEHNPNKNR